MVLTKFLLLYTSQHTVRARRNSAQFNTGIQSGTYSTLSLLNNDMEKLKELDVSCWIFFIFLTSASQFWPSFSIMLNWDHAIKRSFFVLNINQALTNLSLFPKHFPRFSPITCFDWNGLSPRFSAEKLWSDETAHYNHSYWRHHFCQSSTNEVFMLIL